MSLPNTRARVHDDHESTPGMTTLTLTYNALFLLMYLFYFYLLWTRWEVS